MENKTNQTEEPEFMSVASEAVLQMNRAEMENAIDIAKRYPREVKAIKSKVLMLATCDAETAKKCFYSKPVDNKTPPTMAEGPSIRLAEIIAASYSNIKFGSRVIDISEKWVTVQGVCIDLESNVSYTSEEKRSIYSEKGKYRYSQNLIQTTVKAAGAFAVRDAIFKVVPLGIFSTEMKAIKEMAAGKGSGEKLLVRVEKAFKTFEVFSITPKQILERLGVKKKEEITEDHLVILVGLFNSIEDKELTADEAFLPNKVNKENKDDKVQQDMNAQIHGDKDKK